MIRPRHRAAFGAAALAVLMLGLTTAALLRARIAPAGAAPSTPSAGPSITIGVVHGTASFTPALEGTRPLFILVIGSGAHPGQPVQGSLSDSIHLIGVDLAARRATILGIPRDSWVAIPGLGMNKINAASVYGGPQLLARTLERITGIRIDLWVRTSFWGLTAMVDQIGGLAVDVPAPMHDPFSGANFSRGWHHLDGRQALAFARDRHSFLNGDFTRSADAGRLLLAALAKLHSLFTQDPGVVFRWIAVGWRNVQSNISVPTLLSLALTAAQIPTRNVNNLVVPGTTGTVGAASVVFISPSAGAIFGQMRRSGTAAG
jgi:LCP family protein required for cell wall assembly